MHWAGEKSMHQCLAHNVVGCARAVVHFADASQGPDVGCVRMGGEWVNKKEATRHLILRDHAANFLVATQRAAGDLSRNFQTQFGLKGRSSEAGSHNVHQLEELAVTRYESHHGSLHLVMRHESNEFGILPHVTFFKFAQHASGELPLFHFLRRLLE